RGMGRAPGTRAVGDGAYVLCRGGRQGGLGAGGAQIEQIARNVTAVQGDVSRLAALDRLFGAVRERRGPKGRLDVLFANAGIAEGAPLGEISEEHFDRTFGINVKGALFTVQKALPLLADGASIILTSSIVGSKGFANLSVYSATKAALRS